MIEGISADRPASDPRAYVTLVTNADYVLGARALLRSLRLTGTTADLVVMHTEVEAAALAPLSALGARLVRVDLLPTSPGFNAAHARNALHGAAPFTKGEKPPFHTPLDNFAKLRLWQLDYQRVVFIDADALVLKNVDRLFDYPEFSAAPNVYESMADFHRLNSGVFTARPSPATFASMLAHLDRPGVFWRRTDQSFLQDFFPDWHGLPVFDNMLQYVWFALPDLWRWRDIRILHFQYEKPWQDHAKAERLRPLIDLWRAYAGAGPVPDPAMLPDPAVAGGDETAKPERHVPGEAADAPLHVVRGLNAEAGSASGAPGQTPGSWLRVAPGSAGQPSPLIDLSPAQASGGPVTRPTTSDPGAVGAEPTAPSERHPPDETADPPLQVAAGLNAAGAASAYSARQGEAARSGVLPQAPGLRGSEKTPSPTSGTTADGPPTAPDAGKA